MTYNVSSKMLSLYTTITHQLLYISVLTVIKLFMRAHDRASSAVSKYQPRSRAAHQTVYCWQPCLSGCRSLSVERCLIIIIADFLLSIKNSSFSTFIPSPDFLTV